MNNHNLEIQNLKNSEVNKTNINGKIYQTNFFEQINGKTSLEMNGEEFVLLGVNSPSPKFNLPKKGTQHLVAYKGANEQKGSNELKEIGGGIFMSAMLALFPMGELLEQFKSMLEMAHKVKEDSGTKIGVSFTQNINPKDAINPNKAFLPSSPFYFPPPTMLLWDRVRKETTEMKKKKKKINPKGMGLF